MHVVKTVQLSIACNNNQMDLIDILHNKMATRSRSNQLTMDIFCATSMFCYTHQF